MPDKVETDGILVIDKPPGPTSHDLVLAARRIFRGTKIGHLGTLDPFATGVLPLCLGKATRLSQFLGRGEKIYEARILFGSATDTGDFTGKVVFESEPPALSEDLLRPWLEKIQTTWHQMPPRFSARKVDGVPLYVYARQGIEKEGRAREVTVSSVRLLDCGSRECRLRIHCSPGTYIRSIADDLGASMGCGAHLLELRRLAAGEFPLSAAVDGKALLASPRREEVEPFIRPLQDLLPDFPRIVVREESIAKLKFGQTLPSESFQDIFFPTPPASANEPSAIRLMSPSGLLLAIGTASPDDWQENQPARVHPKIVLL